MTALPLRTRTVTLAAIVLAVLFAVIFALPSTPVRGRVRPRPGRARALVPAGARPSTAITGHLPSAQAAGPVSTVSVTPSGRGPVLPQSFLGFSLEYSDLVGDDADPGLLGRVLALIRVPGDGHEVLRIGGNSADGAFWKTTGRPAISPQYEIGPAWLDTLRRLTLTAHLRLLLDLNVPARDPGMAASFASAAERALPPRSIEAFEVGNEPDEYHLDRLDRFAAAADAPPWTRQTWRHFSPATYSTVFRRYAAAVHQSVPGVPLAGPEVDNPKPNIVWPIELILHDRSEVGLISVHDYPLTACHSRGDRLRPTIARTLSPVAASGFGFGVKPVVALARAAGLRLRVTELGSATCGGRYGVSNTFATALWAPDALFSVLRAGVSGVNVHVKSGHINGAFAIGPDGLVARPLLYGLVAFKRTVSGPGRLLRLRISMPRPANVSVWAYRTRGGSVRVLALNKGPTRARLVLHIPASSGSLQRLTASHPWSMSGVTLAGQSIGPDGQWLGRKQLQPVRPGSRGTETVRLAPYSGALVVLRARSDPGEGLRAHPRKHHPSRRRRAPARRSTPRRDRRARRVTPADRTARRRRRRARGRG